ncbi:unnamed protein product [Phytophthora fragariaefolia]|uniref:Unnamed protein product n=1 Tax=Phytophthora fragariaefolia TaxID=1490495 RepID=A0A9W6XC44_9STRA|nr:unnamed protein product [Phytophthora fragariaefolia]
MDIRVRAAQKRPLAGSAVHEVDKSDSSSSEASQSDAWQPTPSVSGADSGDDTSGGGQCVSDVPESTSSMSEDSGRLHVTAAAPNKVEFSSWDELDQYLLSYQVQTFQITNLIFSTLYRFGFYLLINIDLLCLCERSSETAVTPKWRSTMSGFERSNLRRNPFLIRGYNMLGRSSINACVQIIDSEAKTFAVRITRCQLKHNHRLHENSFRAHPARRVVLNDSELRTVDVLRKYGAKKTGIVKYMRDQSDSNPNSQDGRNLVRK